jgi:dienelactone hydrolase
MSRPSRTPVVAALLLFVAAGAFAADAPPAMARADESLAAYFRAEADAIAAACLADVKTPLDWAAKRGGLRKQLFEMLGLDPVPERTDLHATVTGTVDGPGFTVENLHFQSRPHLYVTGNLYVPKNLEKPAPAVLYVCGHSPVKKGDVSYGNKTAYQHHAAWFASHGYVCLVIDTLQLGEIEGIHHGTYREKMWWWNSRGYTPAGVEAWNCIRALDYLQSRKEVDPERLGVTGRSGGGAYSWWVTALDDRIKCAVPVAGITDLHNHVVDGTVEGHCDCMFFVNTYRWDYPAVAALAAPRPLLIENCDKDSIFPLDGVSRLYWKVRGVYGLGKRDDPYHPLEAAPIGLTIGEGGHVDSQELQVAAFQWFNRFLKGQDKPDTPIDLSAARKMFEPEQLRVFKDGLPADQLNSKIHETFVPMAPVPVIPESKEAWGSLRDGWMDALRTRCFRGWPQDGGGPLDLQGGDRSYAFTSQSNVRLDFVTLPLVGGRDIDTVVLQVGTEWERPTQPGMYLLFAPRGTGKRAWADDEKKLTQIRRRFMLLGQTVEGMQVWDVRRAIQAVRAVDRWKNFPIRLEARGEMAAVALYASLFEPPVAELWLHDLPKSHMPQGPHFLNVLRFLDDPQALATAAERQPVRLFQSDPGGWEFAQETSRRLGWADKRIAVVVAPAGAARK